MHLGFATSSPNEQESNSSFESLEFISPPKLNSEDHVSSRDCEAQDDWWFQDDVQVMVGMYCSLVLVVVLLLPLALSF